MYYPYFRGRQYELIALCELLENKCLSDKVIPIVEPVTASPTLIKTVQKFIDEGKKIGLAINPKVGDFFLETKYKEGYIGDFVKLLESDCCVPVHLIGNSYNKLLSPNKFSRGYAVLDSADNIEALNKSDVAYELCLLPDGSTFKHRVKKNLKKVLFENHFNKLERNSDYAKSPDEFFSDVHLYYEEDAYIGFADYSVIGDEYSSSGFAPYAVVIHIVYFDEEKKLRIHHYVSDSNEDISNTAGKLKEALDKFIADERIKELDTVGIRELKKLYKNGNYPGLGSIKKLAIMHHLQLISEYLEKGSD